jgi:MFS family permease
VNLGGRRAWLVWGTALAAYVVAVLQRTSFGVSGTEAAERFGSSASLLSGFVVVQLSVYALLQVPCGLLLDRFGSRTMVAGGAALMAAGQLVLALGHALPVAYLGRVLVGAGDAATFISVLRLAALWFPLRQVPLVTQLTGILGQLGQISSALLLPPALVARGWTATYLGLAAVGVLAATLVVVTVRDAPPGRRPALAGQHRAVHRPLVDAAREPGTWLGFFSHAVTQFPVNVFMLMWGFTFLLAEGLSAGEAGAMFTGVVVVNVISGPLLGVLSGRHPDHRSTLVLACTGAAAVTWAAVLLHPSPTPTWLLWALCVTLGIGGPASVIGIDLARTFNPPERMGIATGLVNAGGFLFAVLALVPVGLALDAHPGKVAGATPPPDAFRSAFAWLGAFWLAAMVGMVVARRHVRRARATAGVPVPSVWRALSRRRGERAVEGVEEDRAREVSS